MVGKIERLIVYGTLLTLFIVCAFFDLEITQGLYQPGNGFGKAFELIGEVPAYVLAVFALSLIAIHHPNDKRWLDLFLFFLMLALGIGVSLYAGNHTFKLIMRAGANMGTFAGWAVRFAIGGLVFAGGFLPARFVFWKADPRECFLFGIFVVATFAASVLLMQGLKMVWLRPRYRTLVALEEVGAISSASDYWLPFFQPQFFLSFEKYSAGGAYGFTDEQIQQAMARLCVTKWEMEEFYSFPSGHSMNTIVLLTLSFLPNVHAYLGQRKRFALICRIAIYVLASLVAFSRILRGAHNATDVLAGLLLGFAVFDLSSTFLYEGFLRKRIVLVPKGEE